MIHKAVAMSLSIEWGVQGKSLEYQYMELIEHYLHY